MARVVLGKVSERPGDASTSTGGGSSAADSLVFLNSVTATGSSVVSSGSFASVATAYIAVKAFMAGLRTATASIIGIRTSSDGTNYSATTDAYAVTGNYNTATQSGVTIISSTTTDGILITDTTVVAFLATTAGASLIGDITLFNLNATATLAFPEIMSEFSFQGSNEVVGGVAWGRRKEAIAQGGIQIYNRGGGNFIDGRVDFFGVKGS